MADNISNEYRDELTENKAHVNIFAAIDHKIYEPNNIKDATHIESVCDTLVKIVHDTKWIDDYSTGYELGEESNFSINSEHDELF